MKPYFFHSKSKIVPCVNTSDVADFERRLNWANAHSEKIHLDISDGIFVKSKTLTLDQLMSGEFKPWVDVHLMVENPLEVLKKQSQLIRIHRVIFHKESKSVPQDVIRFCNDHKIKVGMALSIDAEVSSIKNYVSQLDTVLILTVNLGESGGKFVSKSLSKIDELKKMGFNGKITIDGAINAENIKEVVKYYPDYIISGSYIFKDFNKADECFLRLDEIARY